MIPFTIDPHPQKRMGILHIIETPYLLKPSKMMKCFAFQLTKVLLSVIINCILIQERKIRK